MATAEAVGAALSVVADAVHMEITAALGRVADLVATEARRSLNASATSPSAPSGTPADPSGTLAASIIASPGDGSEPASVALTGPHAIALEYGTSHMAARPFLRPAAEAMRADAQAMLADAFARAVSSSLKDLP